MCCHFIINFIAYIADMNLSFDTNMAPKYAALIFFSEDIDPDYKLSH